MYILQCADGSYYTGSTWNLERRFWEHQNGLGANHTAKRLPVKLVYCEQCDRIEDAYIREKQIQGWSRKKKEALFAGDTSALHQLAKCRNESHHAGFGSAQPAGLNPFPLSGAEGSGAEGSGAEGSGAEGSGAEGSGADRSPSGVEGNEDGSDGTLA
jgi:putative endonuclease